MKNIALSRISICGANQNTSIAQIIEFLYKCPNANLVIDIDSKSCAKGSSLYNWLKRLNSHLDMEDMYSRIAYRVSGDWAYELTTEGRFPTELKKLLYQTPGFPCIILEIAKDKTHLYTQDPTELSELLDPSYVEPVGMFILEVNDATKKFVQKLQRKTNHFEAMYNLADYFSLADCYRHFGVAQNFYGELNCQNVYMALKRINDQLKTRTEINLHTKTGLLKGDHKSLDFAKAEQFVNEANSTADSNLDEIVPPDADDPWAKYELGE